jgi:uncharacterized protein (DUF1330 family)
MTVYIVAQINIHDRDRYREYEAGFMKIFSQHQGRLLSVDETPEILEGDWPHSRTVLIEFPSSDEAHAWYDSTQYQDLAGHRHAASVGRIAMLSGLV